MERKLMLLVNPHAGKGAAIAALGGVLERLSHAGWLPTVYFTRRAGHATELAARRGGDYERLVCMGGDGTLSEVCAGLMCLPERRPLGYIPMGTSNDVAHSLGLSADPLAAAEQAGQGSPVALDMGAFGEETCFTYVAAFGAFTDVSYDTPQEAKQALGHLAYMLEGLRRLPKLRAVHATVETDGETLEGDFLFGAVTNSTRIAGLVRLDDDAVDLSDGQFEILLVRSPKNLLDLGGIIGAVLSADFSDPSVSFLKSSRARFRFQEPVAWTRDGERGGAHLDLTLRNCHPGVEILV
ncbi:MAG: diacylglycerol kinase family lipid kinase [Oscillospiraceae bacterium]|nr:diacylglycerol kinase family lipid kinase [Oscillospiraceae bacterium]MBR3861837.1 diacylglycerol kinase family lipid kinase [Oscillospiraceae bacterium]